MLRVHSSIEMMRVLHLKSGNDECMLKLTPRGKQVFHLILEGLTDNQIRERLGISYSCVRRHREKMLLQNDCESMLELIAKYHGKRDGG
jgi:FixJ family two-component response regulator